VKISQELRPVIKKGEKPKGNIKGTDPFAAIVGDQQAKLHVTTLDRLFADIEKQSERLLKSQTFEDFRLFKKQVKQFVKEAVSFGLELKRSYNWHHHGGAKTLKRVEEIDRKLVEMADTLLNKEKKAVGLLDQIGEIKGLLINLYR
jgi:uncharacterized protein YaaR (DUF327 family)